MTPVLTPSEGHFYLLQDPGRGLTDTLSIGAHFRELGQGPEWRDRILPILHSLKLDLPGIFNRKPASFSGGERQRLMLAMILVQNPTWLVCDEPAASLDEKTQDAIWQWIFSRKTETGMTVMFATHRPELVRGGIDHIFHFQDGQIIGAPKNRIVRETTKMSWLTLEKDQAKPTKLESNQGMIQWHQQPLMRWEHFSMARGEAIWLSGISGSGKTTFGRILAGLETRHQTTLRLDDQPLARAFFQRTPFQKQAMAYLFQHGTQSLNPMREVSRQLEDAYETCPENLTQVLRTLKLDGLRLAATPDHFSIGEIQRLNLARTLAHQPQFLIADELLAPLDRSSRIAVLTLLASCQEQWQLAILMLGHDLSLREVLPGKHFTIARGELKYAGH